MIRRSIPLLLLAFLVDAQVSVTMNRYDPASTGANTHEVVLNQANVTQAGFGKLYAYYVDGAVYAQPLYMPGIAIQERGARNVLYIATMNDKFYAFDADRPGPPIWLRDFTGELKGVAPVPVSDITGRPDLNIVGNVGILGTPVIDPSAHAIFCVARTRENGDYFQRLHKLDLATGKDLHDPIVIEAAVKSSAKDAINGLLRFDPRAGNQRPALALVKGSVIIAWASHEDIEPYHGWVMAYDASTLKPNGAFCLTPAGREGGIWQSGRGPAVGADGSIYFEVGIGDWDGLNNFGSSVLRFAIRPKGLALEDYFTPHDYAELNERDADIGSTGPLLIPGTNHVIAGSKKGIFYVLDGRHLGHMTPEDAGVLELVATTGGRMLSGPAYWEGPAGPAMYEWSESDFIRAYLIKDGLLERESFTKGAVPSKGSPGGTISISADGPKPGTGIVWATGTTNGSADHGNAAGALYAFNAETLETLWSSQQNVKRDRLGTLVKFVAPVVAVGRVYIPNFDNAVNVYGLLGR
jgi:outer membrane protein assembly factor BamB